MNPKTTAIKKAISAMENLRLALADNPEKQFEIAGAIKILEGWVRSIREKRKNIK